MKDLGKARRILGIDIVRDRENREIWLFQTDYIKRVLKRFKMIDNKKVSTPLAAHFKLSVDQRPKNGQDKKEMNLIPYASIMARPDIAHAISVTNRFIAENGKDHWIAMKLQLRYLKGASYFGILFKGTEQSGDDAIVGYCDSNYARNIDNKGSQSGYIFNVFGSTISWRFSLQNVVALYTAEAEYMTLTSALKESFWIKGLAAYLGIKQQNVAIGCDSSNAICLAKHQTFLERSKHIDVRLHFVREEVEKGIVKVFKVDTSVNPADMLTKPIPRDKFELCLKLISMERK